MIALAKAKLCSNCEGISDATGERCPACGSVANWLTLASLLGSVKEPPEMVVIWDGQNGQKE
jgi:RNA polymerase subunit RPABC4/transcription elongation factor Spt4